MSNILAALTELAQAELSLSRAYGRALFLATNGVLRDVERTKVHAVRDEVYDIEQAFAAKVRPVFASVGLEGRMPTPQRLPDLPSGVTPPIEGTGAEGPVGVAGLGAVPPAVIFAAVILGVVQMVATAWVVVRVIDVGGTLITNTFYARENTKRIERSLEVLQARFIECLRRTGNPSQCAADFPLPAPQLEQGQAPPRDPIGIGIGIGAAVAVAGTVGWLGWQVWGTTSAAKSSSRAGARKLSEREVTRRLSA